MALGIGIVACSSCLAVGLTWGRSSLATDHDGTDLRSPVAPTAAATEVPPAPEPAGLHVGRSAHVELPGGILRGMVRAEPNLNAPIIERLVRRSEVRLVEQSSDTYWWRVTAQGLPASGGWMHRSLLRDPTSHAFGSESVELERWAGSYEARETCTALGALAPTRALTLTIAATGGPAPSARLTYKGEDKYKGRESESASDVTLRLSSRGIDVVSIHPPGSTNPPVRLFGLAETESGLVTEWGALTPLCDERRAATSVGAPGFQRKGPR